MLTKAKEDSGRWRWEKCMSGIGRKVWDRRVRPVNVRGGEQEIRRGGHSKEV